MTKSSSHHFGLCAAHYIKFYTMKKLIVVLSSGALVLPEIANACYLTPNFKNIFLSGIIGLVLSAILITLIHKKISKLFAKKYKYYLLFIPIYIIMTLILIMIIPLDKTTIECGNTTGNEQLPENFGKTP